MAAAIATDPNVLNKYKAGFNECATEVSRYVNHIEGVDQSLRQRLVAHLSQCVNSLSTTEASLGAASPFGNSFPNSFAIAFPGMIPPPGGSPFVVAANNRVVSSPLQVQIPPPLSSASALSGYFSSSAANAALPSGSSAFCPSRAGDINNNSNKPGIWRPYLESSSSSSPQSSPGQDYIGLRYEMGQSPGQYCISPAASARH